jgi:hypothetical protein
MNTRFVSESVVGRAYSFSKTARLYNIITEKVLCTEDLRFLTVGDRALDHHQRVSDIVYVTTARSVVDLVSLLSNESRRLNFRGLKLVS